MSRRVEKLALESGRTIALHRLAEGDGRTIVFCHAAPGSAGFDPSPDETRRRNITLLAVDRPGYGGSMPPTAGEWASVDRAADDVAEVLDRMSIERVGVAGWSAGGRVALALAAPARTSSTASAVLATPAPDEEVPWIPPPRRRARAMRGMPPDEAHAGISEQIAGFVPADARSDEALGLLGLSRRRRAALAADGARDRLGDMLEGAFAQGPIGMAADIAGYTPASVGLRAGRRRREDAAALRRRRPDGPSAHGRWWQKHLPNARLEMVPNAGHLLVIPMWGRVLSHLAPSRSG